MATLIDSSGEKSYRIYPKKQPGTAVFIVTWKNAADEEFTREETVTVKEYPNEIKSLKINGKKIKIKGGTHFEYFKTGYKKTYLKVQMKLNSGWKIKSVEATMTKGETEKPIKLTKKMLTKGTKIKFPKNCSEFYIWIDMKKGNDVIPYEISLWR